MENDFERAIIFLAKPCKCGNLPVIQYDFENKQIYLKCCVFETPKLTYTTASGELARTLAQLWNKQQGE